MRKAIMIFALAMGIVTANAQENKTVKESNGSDGQPTLTKEVYPQKEAEGDLYHGLTKKLTFDRMIPPHGLEVTYDKTVHIIFPAEVRYVDLGSPNLIAGKADGAENVIRVKATVKNFKNETNMSVITEDGSYPTVSYKIAAQLEALTGQETRVTVPGHYQRGGPPCPYDRVLASQFGTAAAELIINRQYNRMVAIQNGEICSIPLEEAASRTKFLPVDHPMIQVARDLGICMGD